MIPKEYRLDALPEDLLEDLPSMRFELMLNHLCATFSERPDRLRKVIGVFWNLQGENVYIAITKIGRLYHLEAAAGLIRSGMSFRQIPGALAARFGISKTTARRVRDLANCDMKRKKIKAMLDGHRFNA